MGLKQQMERHAAPAAAVQPQAFCLLLPQEANPDAAHRLLPLRMALKGDHEVLLWGV